MCLLPPSKAASFMSAGNRVLRFACSIQTFASEKILWTKSSTATRKASTPSGRTHTHGRARMRQSREFEAELLTFKSSAAARMTRSITLLGMRRFVECCRSYICARTGLMNCFLYFLSVKRFTKYRVKCTHLRIGIDSLT